MSQIGSSTHVDRTALYEDVRRELQSCSTLQAAAQATAETVYRRFPESLALVRVYATNPLGSLPFRERAFATNVANKSGAGTQLEDKTFVLCLLGSDGTKPEWKDRLRSAGHLAIPLCGAAFVESIPMVSRLMHDMGLGLSWLDRFDSGVVVKKLSAMAGLFFVADAATNLDAQGRLIVPAQGFVAEQRVKSVFGLGGSYPSGTFVTILCFCRESLTREQVELFLPLINVFKTITMEQAMSRHIFA